MTDLSQTIAPKSDQINADDLIGGPRVITVSKVSANPSSAEQPVSVHFEGDEGKPFKPCKSMRRVMVHVWGKDGNQYVGRSMMLYCDPSVTFGGMAVGGIRISHMTDIDSPVTMALTTAKARRKPYKVMPLQAPNNDGIEAPVGTLSEDQQTIITALAETASVGLDALCNSYGISNGDLTKMPVDKFDNIQNRLNATIKTNMEKVAE